MMTDDQLNAIEARAEAAQRGTWFCDGTDIWHAGESYESKDDPHFYTGISIDPKLTKSPKALANLEFCAQARADIPALVAEVRRLRELCAECIESIEDWAGYASDYYREKHGYEGEINDYKARLNGAESEGA